MKRTPRTKRPARPLTVRLDRADKAVLADAARLRRISVSDYVRTVTVAQAAREVGAAQAIALTKDEQLAFWKALAEPPVLTPAQRKLRKLMRGKR
jgi:uncharacterized protein (DUF1778 family)